MPLLDQSAILETTPLPGRPGRFVHAAPTATGPATAFCVPEASNAARA